MRTQRETTPTARSGYLPAIVAAGTAHLLFAGSAFAVGTWLAVRTSGGACNDSSSCLEVNLKLVGLTLIGYAIAFAAWAAVLHRLLGSTSANAARRASTAALAQLIGGAVVLMAGIAAGSPWSYVGAVLAIAITPTLVTWWATASGRLAEQFLPWWRRPGW